MISSGPARLGLVALVAAAASLAGHGATFGQGAAKSVNLAPHVAIYDLTLKSSRGKRALESVRGRIVYDFSGSSCEGYALQFRQVTELDSGEGKVALTDLRTTTWEEGDGKSFRFKSQNYMDRQQIGEVDGSADREKSSVAVKLSKPEDKKFDVGHRRVSDRAHAAADRGRRGRHAAPRNGRLRWLRVRARRSIIRCR